ARGLRVLDRLAFEDAEVAGALEGRLEPIGVGVERDLVRVWADLVGVGREEDERRRADPKRPVRALEALAGEEPPIESAQASRVGRAKRDVVDADDPHRRESPTPG